MKTNQHSTAKQAWLPVLAGLAAAGLFADRRASGQDKEAPDPGHDRAARSPARPARSRRRRGRAARRGVRLVRGAGLGSRRRLPALLRRPAEHGLPVEGGQGVSVFLKPSGYTGTSPARRRAGLERPADGPAGPARPLPARRPPRRPARRRTASSSPWPTATRASGSTAPTTASSSRTATSTSPTPPTACSS